MNLLFSENGMQRMNEIVQPGLLCAFDFDGTLAPIVVRPEDVQLPYDVQQRLITLSRYVPIAIITGRAVITMQKHLGFSPDFIIGNHGIEGLPGWADHAKNYPVYCDKWEQTVIALLHEQAAFEPRILIENKQYSLAIHYRSVRDPGDMEQRLRYLFAQLAPPPRVIPGKYVFNLLPQDATDKGVALVKMMSSYDFRSAIYVGDDVTDEDVFRLHRPDILTVRIENAIDSAADFFLRQRGDIRHLLDELIMRLRQLRKTHLASASRVARQETG
jgi:trehalose 6-phosphate phosphatase